MNKVYKNWFFLLFSDVSNSIFQFIIFIVLARKLSPEGYGNFNTVLSIVALFSTFAIGLGTNHVVIRELAVKPKATKKLVKKVFPLRLISYVLTIIALVIYETYVVVEKPVIIIFAIILIFATAAWDFGESIAFGHFVTKYTMYFNIGISAVWMIGILLIPEGIMNYTIILLMYTVLYLLRGILYFILSYKKFAVPNTDDESVSTKRIFKMSIPYFWMRSIGSFTDQIPILVLKSVGGAAQVGFYSVGNKLILPITLAINTGLRAMFPYLTKLHSDNKEEFNKKLSESFIIIMLFGGTIAALVVSVGVWIIPLLLGESYKSSIEVLNYLVWYGVVLCFDSLLSTVLSSTYRQKMLAIITTIDIIIILPMLYFGAQNGAVGLAFMRMIGSIILILYHILLVIHIMKIKLSTFNFYFSCCYVLALILVSLLIKDQILRFILVVIVMVGSYIIPKSPVKYYVRFVIAFIKNQLGAKNKA